MNKHDTDALALSLSQDRPEASPDPDPDLPLAEPHATHDWVLLSSGYAECAICAARDHWRAGGEPCPLAPEAEGIAPEVAFDRLWSELRAFVQHWTVRGFGSRPSMNDWRSEAFEHARDPKARFAPRKR